MDDLVIARFDEDLGWVDRVPASFRIFLYNKGAPVADRAVLERVALLVGRPNRGREAETYLHHLLTAAPAGDGMTVFTQGDPFDHNPQFLECLAARAQWAPVQPLSFRWLKGPNLPPLPPPALLERWQAGRPWALSVRPEPFSLMTWAPLHFHDVGPIRTGRLYREHHGLAFGANIAAHFLELCGLEPQARLAAGHVVGGFAYGAIFAAANARCAGVPRAALERMHAFTLDDRLSYGHVFERLWLHIFGAPFLLPESDAGLLRADDAHTVAP